MNFYVGLHMPSHSPNFERCMVSTQCLKTRKSDFYPNKWMLDSGAFTQIVRDGRYKESVGVYAEQIKRWSNCGELEVSVSQDYMCEEFALKITGKTIPEHQRMTIDRYDQLVRFLPTFPIMPVLQGYEPDEYAEHLDLYGARLTQGAWVGVGSVCKRNGKPDAIVDVLTAIKTVRPDLRLHGFGVKLTSVRDERVRSLLWSADSMAWSFSARKQGRNGNSWQEADAYRQKIDSLPTVLPWRSPTQPISVPLEVAA